MRKREIKLGQKVKVVKKSPSDACPMEGKYMGQTGVITRATDGNSVDTLIEVTFTNNDCDGFWIEELRKVKNESVERRMQNS